jgi:uncharacterized linocin/CFP29 family protein
MNGNLGREKLWNPQIWSDIDKAVQEEVGRVRVAQKVFPCTLLPSGQPIPRDKLSSRIPGALMISEGLSKPFVQIEVEFALTQSQVDNEESRHTGRTLARMAANRIAATEDILLFQGRRKAIGFVPGLLKGKSSPGLVKEENANSLRNGFLGEDSELGEYSGGIIASAPSLSTKPDEDDELDEDGDSQRALPVLPVKDVIRHPDDIVKQVAQGIAILRNSFHVGPYALFLPSEKFADASAPTSTFHFATAADRINPLVTGGFYGTGSLPSSDGLLVSLGGEPTTIYIGNDATVEFTQVDLNGRYRFRVFERFQSVVRDSNVFVRFKLE